MSEFKDPDNKPAPTNEAQAGTQQPQHAELPPYRQAEAASNNKSAKLPPWLIPVLIAVLVIGVVLGRYWGSSADEVREESVASSGVAGGNDVDSTASTEQSVLSVETVSPSQDDIGTG